MSREQGTGNGGMNSQLPVPCSPVCRVRDSVTGDGGDKQSSTASLPFRIGCRRQTNGWTRLTSPRIPIAAVGVADRCEEPQFHARFKSIPASEFDHRHVDRLGDLAWGTWHAGLLSKQLKAQKSTAKLPASLVEVAVQVERRMQRCCEYHLSDDPVASKELQRLRPGVDYIDLAGDLAGYAKLYGDHIDIVSADTKYYRADDRELALRTSAQIVKLLGEGMTSAAASARNMAVRCFTLLNTSYNEVAEVGRWLLRNDPNPDVSFPSLYAVARKPTLLEARPCEVWRCPSLDSARTCTTFGLLRAGTKTFPEHLNLPERAPRTNSATSALPQASDHTSSRTIFLPGVLQLPASRSGSLSPVARARLAGCSLHRQVLGPSAGSLGRLQTVWILDLGRFQSQSWLMSAPSSSSTVLTSLVAAS